jgi:hypothetical protein
MSFSHILDRGKGPTRLFIGGVHGKEGLTTRKALKHLSGSSVKDGKLIIHNFGESPYISTLEKRYYASTVGSKVLSLIKDHNPDIYLELHSYKPENYYKLTAEDRREKTGVPPLIELEEGILMGSVSPLIRITFFHKCDFPFVLEIPSNPSKKSFKVYLNILNLVAGSRDRNEILEKLGSKYPSAVKKARKYFIEFSDNVVLIFEKAKEKMKNTSFKDPNFIKNYITYKASLMNLVLTEKQAEQIVQALSVYEEHFPDSNIRTS